MRLLEWNDKEDYQPLERGNAFPQFYENGDKFNCHSNAFDWHYRFWFDCLAGWSPSGGLREDFENLMGCEL